MAKETLIAYSLRLITLLSQWILAATFLFSGFVKALDPVGMAYKLEAYCAAVGVELHVGSLYLDVAVIALTLAEFTLGVYLLLGMRQRVATIGAFFFMLLMTFVTGYIYWTDAVSDCGCFGDAVVLTHRETFGKNLVLLGITLLLLRFRRRSLRIITEHNQWLLSLYATAYMLGVLFYSLHYLPVVDFTGYNLGTDIQQAMQGKMHSRFVYEKDGVEQTFDEDALPDSTWSFVRSVTVIEEEPTIQDFSLINAQGEEITDAVLADSQFVFLATLPYVPMADAGCSDALNDVYDYAADNGYPFYGVTNATGEEIQQWRDRTGAAYPYVWGAAEMLKGLVRSNPGLVLLHKGRIIAKWGHNDMPNDEELRRLDTAVEMAQRDDREATFGWLFLWFVAPFSVLLLLDRLWLGHRYLRIYHYYKSQKNKTTMRKHIVAGNWKMNKNLQEGIALATELKEILTAEKPNCDVVIGTPFIHLAKVSEVVAGSPIAVSAENCADKASGAYTGEVSAEMVKSTGAEYVILGHSERREYYHETPEILKEKVDLALANGLKVIFCIGESLAQREANEQEAVCKAELEGSVFHLTAEQWSNVVIAYEPIWAIGTGKTATAEQAQEIHAFIRSVVAEKFGVDVADNTSILYGGSCNGKNAPELFAKADIDGGLIGGASLKAADFKAIIDAWK